MITVFQSKGGKLSFGTLDSKGKKFIDCLRPSEKELKLLSKKLKIPFEDISDASDPSERPRVMTEQKYSLAILKAPIRIKDNPTTSPIAFFISKNFILAIRHSKNEIFKKFETNIEIQNKIIKEGISGLAYWFIDEIISNYFPFMDEIEEKIDHIENKVYKSSNEKIVHEIFLTKKSLIFFHKALTANREVINSIEKEYLKQFSKNDIKRFQNTYNDVVELLDLESTYRDILTGTMDTYLTTVSNNLNIVMKKMTAMGSFILIPTLISGIYGMNFRFLPEKEWVYGYPFAIGLMAISVLALYFFFKKKKWL